MLRLYKLSRNTNISFYFSVNLIVLKLEKYVYDDMVKYLTPYARDLLRGSCEQIKLLSNDNVVYFVELKK